MHDYGSPRFWGVRTPKPWREDPPTESLMASIRKGLRIQGKTLEERDLPRNKAEAMTMNYQVWRDVYQGRR